MFARNLTLTNCILLGSLLAAVASGQPYFYLANSGGNNISVVNSTNNSFAWVYPSCDQPNGVALTPGAAYLYIACAGDNAVNVVSTASNTLLSKIGVGTTPTQVAISPNGAQAYVVDRGSNQVSVIDTGSQSLVATIGVGSRPVSVAFSPDGSQAYVANAWDNTVSVINTSSRSVVGVFNAGSGPNSIAAFGGHVYVANQYSDNVTVHDLSGNLLATIGGLTFPTALAITPDGSRVYVTNGNANSVSVISTGSNNVFATIGVGLLPMALAVSSDGTQVYVANDYGFSLSQISVASNSVVNTISNVGIYPVGVATAPAGQQQTTSCSYSFSSGGASFGSGGGSGTAGVNAPGGCGWSASSDSSWLNITSGSSGNGNGSVSFSVGGNPSVSSRTGHLVVNGQSFTVTQSGQGFSGIHVRCGGPQLTDGNGTVWSSDNASTYSVTNSSIANTNTPALYQAETWSTGALQYSFNVPNGSFTVTLKFAEFYLTQRGQRVANIYVNGNLVSSNFDILANTGPNTAFDLSIPVNVTSGQVTISIVPVNGSAKIDAIQIN